MHMAKKIIISRTDSIGDVVLTLPMTGAIKKELPDSQIIFLGRNYVKPIVDTSVHVDDFLSWDEIESLPKKEQLNHLKSINADIIIHVFPNKKIARLAAKAKIPLRIGTSHRTYHWLNCNKLISLGRKNSDLHESQLNMELLSPLGIKTDYKPNEIPDLYGLEKPPTLPENFRSILSKEKPNVILHPTSKGSAREWGLDNFGQLIDLISEETNIIVSGTKEDALIMTDFLQKYGDKINDLAGKMDLETFIALIAESDFLIAASTGPLHIAAALGIRAIGIYAPMRPIHPERWGPIGRLAEVLVLDKECDLCKKSMECECIRSISAESVKNKIFGE